MPLHSVYLLASLLALGAIQLQAQYLCTRTDSLIISTEDWCQLNCETTGCATNIYCSCTLVSGTLTATASASLSRSITPTVSITPPLSPSHSVSPSLTPSASQSPSATRNLQCMGNPGWVDDMWCQARCELPNWADYCCWLADFGLTFDQALQNWPSTECNCLCPPVSASRTPTPTTSTSRTPSTTPTRSRSFSRSTSLSPSFTPSNSPTTSVMLQCYSNREGVLDESCQSACSRFPRDEEYCTSLCECTNPTSTSSASASCSSSASESPAPPSASRTPSPTLSNRVVAASPSPSPSNTHLDHLPARGWHPFAAAHRSVAHSVPMAILISLFVAAFVL